MERLFDPSALMTQNLAANATKRTPLPVGETTAQIVEMEIANGTVAAGKKNAGAPWARLDCKLEITDPEYLKLFPGDAQRDKAFAFLGIMLDLQDGQIATGPDRNVRLGKLREACGVQGQPLNALNGQWLRIQIGHKPNPNEPGDVLAEVVGYTAMQPK